MNNLYRDLAPVSDAAWSQIEEEATRTLKRHLAGRRVVDVHGPATSTLSAIGTGHVGDAVIEGPVQARLRQVQPLVEVRVPFDLDRLAIDDVERGAEDSDWQAVKDAARQIAFFEDRAIFDGNPASRISGVRTIVSNPGGALPGDIAHYPDAIAGAVSQLRLAGVAGPYSVVLDAEAYTAVAETTIHGFPVLEHIQHVVDGDIIWAPAIAGAIVLSGRGGDYALHLGQDFSIGYLSHTDVSVRLYLQETFTFLPLTAEAAVSLSRA